MHIHCTYAQLDPWFRSNSLEYEIRFQKLVGKLNPKLDSFVPGQNFPVPSTDFGGCCSKDWQRKFSKEMVHSLFGGTKIKMLIPKQVLAFHGNWIPYLAEPQRDSSYCHVKKNNILYNCIPGLFEGCGHVTAIYPQAIRINRWAYTENFICGSDWTETIRFISLKTSRSKIYADMAGLRFLLCSLMVSLVILVSAAPTDPRARVSLYSNVE